MINKSGNYVFTKEETAKQIISQVLEFMQDNDYIDSWEINGLNKTGDIEQLQDIAYGNIEAYNKNRSSYWKKQAAQ